MKLSEMRQLLAARGIQLTKSLGQNFLHDANQLRRIVDLADLSPGDRVLEIGPGLGPLTGELLARGVEVLAIEKDARLVELLQERFQAKAVSSLAAADAAATDPATARSANEAGPAKPRLRLLRADALEVLRREPRDWSGWKLVANMPYSVASPILVELALAERAPERVVVTLQLEVLRRLLAGPGGDDYGVLTLLVRLGYAPCGWFKIPPNCFFPAPDVDSTCAGLVRHRVPLLPAEQRRAFARLVKLAFSQRRKKMFKLLKAAWPAAQLETAFAAAGLDPQIRAEKLSLDQFLLLTTELARPTSAATGAASRSMLEELFDVVNERDEVIDRRPRSEVHRLGLKHRAVHVLLFNRRGELFLQKRSLAKDCFPGTWDSSASGHLAPGESYEACAWREVEEELGWRLKQPPARLFKIDACPATGQEFVWVYRAQAEGPFVLQPEEISEGDWFTPEHITRWLAERPQDFAGSVPVIWQQLQAAGKTGAAGAGGSRK